ncbi:RNA 2'-phosphotransferase [Inediibacterium massiliense]|uniref:RNA 2'-phosphotransferase n=1 Tax=Inediibacterium massiliense TaxID=1658111 RepID=UPI0006B5C348|nr:RNA 2'-phosphotransferase [Inediibacterium massiliense]
MENPNTKLSKYISLILRHKPEIIGVKLDNHGWCDVDDLLFRMNKNGKIINRSQLDEIVKMDDKDRYTYNDDGTKIRANQGHSIDVDIELEKEIPPQYLYHGTIQKYVLPILKEGIKKGQRQYVHLSTNIEIAKIVGKRRGIPVILKIEAGKMYLDGYQFYLSKNKVWLCDYVPNKYISVM